MPEGSHGGSGVVNREAVEQYSLRVWKYKQGEAVSLMIHLGDRLGLYKAMASGGSATAGELAETAGVSERWVEEWLRGQVAAGLVDLEDGRFVLPDEGVAVLAAEGASPYFAAGVFTPMDRTVDAERIASAFVSGTGFSYDALGEESMLQSERMTGPQIEFLLVRFVLSQIDGLVERLRAGGRGVDVGCGAGVATRVLARTFPNSSFVGYDTSSLAIARAREISEPNLEFVEAGAGDVPAEASFDVALAFDSLHDMPRPDLALAAIRRALRPDGVLVIKDIKSTGDFEKDRRNPLLALMYGFSVSACLGSGLSTEDGLGLGTLGFHPEVAERMCRSAGFSRFRTLDVPDPANLYYEARP